MCCTQIDAVHQAFTTASVVYSSLMTAQQTWLPALACRVLSGFNLDFPQPHSLSHSLSHSLTPSPLAVVGSLS